MIDYAKVLPAVTHMMLIITYDEAGNVIKTHEHTGGLKGDLDGWGSGTRGLGTRLLPNQFRGLRLRFCSRFDSIAPERFWLMLTTPVKTCRRHGETNTPGDTATFSSMINHIKLRFVPRNGPHQFQTQRRRGL